MRRRLSALLGSAAAVLLITSCDDPGDDQRGFASETCKAVTLEAQKFFRDLSTGNEREIFASDLKERLDNGLPTYVVDVRPLHEYSAAHIPTAVSLPLDVMFTYPLCPRRCGHDQGPGKDWLWAGSPGRPTGGGHDHDGDDCKSDSLALPTDGTPIVLVSSNGHGASLAAGVLGVMGYNVYVLRFGMISWVNSSDVPIFRSDATQRIRGINGPLEL